MLFRFKPKLHPSFAVNETLVFQGMFSTSLLHSLE